MSLQTFDEKCEAIIALGSLIGAALGETPPGVDDFAGIDFGEEVGT